MKIVLTGGGSGGHFYPIIAVAQSLHEIVQREHLVDVRIYFISDSPYDERALFENGVEFKQAAAGKMRRYFSILNVFDVFKTAAGIVKATIQLFNIFPNVVFAKGGYASFPTLCAARFLRIPVIIHESDSVPGRLNKWAGKFARRIAVSYPEAARYFPEGRVAVTGNPVRREIAHAVTEGAYDFFNLEPNVPVLLVIGGSLGAEIINDTLDDILPELVETYQIIHQTGKKNFEAAKGRAAMALDGNPKISRYRPYAYFDDLTLKMAAGAASLVVSRAGSAIFEIAAWNLPSIIIPITDSNGDHQRSNAYLYARSGACKVLEEGNLSPHVLLNEVKRLLDAPAELAKMKDAAKSFYKPDAADKIARALIDIAIEQENS